MKPETIPAFDCLEFKWKVQSEIYERTKGMTVDEQISFFRDAVESGPFAHLLRAVSAPRQRGKADSDARPRGTDRAT